MIATASIIFALFCVYTVAVPWSSLHPVHLLIFLFAETLAIFGLESARKKGVNLSNLFMLCFFTVMAMNCLMLSKLQVEKEITDIYYYFWGPILFAAILYIGEKPVRRIRHFNFKLNIQMVALGMWVLYCLFQIYMFSVTGIRFFSNDWMMNQSTNYVIPGVTGLMNMFMWSALMMLPNVKWKRLKALIIISTLVFCLLSAQRGDALRVGVFVIVQSIHRMRKRIFTRKNLRLILILLLVCIIGFSVWGNYRQRQRGWTSAITVGTILASHVENDTLNWLYAYTGMNFDVLKQIYIDGEPTGEIIELFIPIIYLTQGSAAVEEHYNRIVTSGINGWNASTFLGYFIGELGGFYFISVVVLGIIVAVLSRLCRSASFRGGYDFLMMITAFTPFGNYYLKTNYFFSLIVCILLYFFVVDGSDDPVFVQQKRGRE